MYSACECLTIDLASDHRLWEVSCEQPFGSHKGCQGSWTWKTVFLPEQLLVAKLLCQAAEELFPWHTSSGKTSYKISKANKRKIWKANSWVRTHTFSSVWYLHDQMTPKQWQLKRLKLSQVTLYLETHHWTQLPLIGKNEVKHIRGGGG